MRCNVWHVAACAPLPCMHATALSSCRHVTYPACSGRLRWPACPLLTCCCGFCALFSSRRRTLSPGHFARSRQSQACVSKAVALGLPLCACVSLPLLCKQEYVCEGRQRRKWGSPGRQEGQAVGAHLRTAGGRFSVPHTMHKPTAPACHSSAVYGHERRPQPWEACH